MLSFFALIAKWIEHLTVFRQQKEYFTVIQQNINSILSLPLLNKLMIIIRNKLLFSLCLLSSLFGCLNSFSQVPGKTVIKGIVTDAKTGEPVPFASAILKGTTVGTITDIKGKYNIETSVPATKIEFSYLGYQTESQNISQGKEQTINIRLKLSVISLDEVTIKPKRVGYKNKNNPAVELIDKVIANKSVNRKEAFDYLEYKQYEKIQFALSNVSERFKKGNFFGKFKSVFENVDTTKRIGNGILHFFIKETLSDHYFRKDPAATKEIITAEKTINLDEYLDNNGITSHLKYVFQNINIYYNEILFLTNKFVSPIASTAPLFYRYYIIDTLNVNNIKCVRLFFEPRNQADFLFHGHLYVTLDSSYAIRKIDIGINKNINIDWVQDISVVQDFEQFGQKGWLLSKDEIEVDFGIMKNTMGLYGQRTISYKDYKINEPIDDKIFKGPEKIEKIDLATKNPAFWETNRYIPLNKSENGIYAKVDSIKKIPAFKRRMTLIMLISTNFYNLGKIELGPDDSFFSFNSVEGARFRVGGMTTPDFSRKLNFDAYTAYGFKDQLFKYRAGITYSLSPRTIYEFPVKSIRVSYQDDYKVHGQELQFSQRDNLFLSVNRGTAEKLLLNRTFKTEYLNEFENHFSILAGYSFTRQSARGELTFNTVDYRLTSNVSNINISEIFTNLRFAPNETFYQGRLYRSPFPSREPVISLKIAGGTKSIGSDYDYLRLQLTVSKRVYLSILGYTDITIDGGKIFGQVPYSLLFVHAGNQSYTYQKNSYNMMNFLEFVSDQYVSVNAEHCFNGFFFNKVPLLKKLKLRELVTCKVIYGGVTKTNNPDYQSNLFKFPTTTAGIPETYTLERKPYAEAGIGVSNIFKVLRVDLIQRFTYLNLPNVSKTGFRIQFKLDM